MVQSFIVFQASFYLTRLADQSFANLTGLHSLRHGTNPFSWMAIHCLGGDPNWGGANIGGDGGSSSIYYAKNKNRFYFAKGGKHASPGTRAYSFSSIRNMLCHKLLGHTHEDTPLDKTHVIVLISATSVALLLPVIKFRYTPDEVDRFAKPDGNPARPGYDPEFQAYSTTSLLPPWRIGLMGTLFANVTTPGLFHRIVNNSSERVIPGLAQLALAVSGALFTWAFCPSFVTEHKVALIAGAILAIV